MYDNQWRKYSRRRLDAFPFCARCEALGRVRFAVVTDHVTPHKGDALLFWDSSNHQSLCKRCHDRKTRLEDGGFGSSAPIEDPARRASYDNTTTMQASQCEALPRPITKNERKTPRG